ncbi:unnamed protein product [Paramecium octaurelia]|uniref:C3HC-type domain-containing protein n=1 Tax=Paramecium octaurelia TaxID=43137 RepID=A0A8S1TFP1_PAROT|nr:unnamed protein product [Paramecium octaurelia]
MYQQYFDDYCERLFSYNFLNWPYRDSKLKPSKMASIGYICHEDSLQCFYCQKKIMIDDQMLPSDVILERAINQHDQYCQAMAIKFKVTQEFLHSYGMAYYDECLASWKDPIELKKTYLDKVPQNLHFLVQNPKQVLAIFGWIKQDQILLCKFCGRKCQIVEEEFDVFQEHRYFCKWANEGRNIKYGYLIVLQQLRDQSTQNNQDAKERENNNVEQDVLRKTLVSQCENIISINLLTNTELQKAKAQILACQDQLTKRKRFDIKESEREMEEFELDIQKKVKVQKEQIEERNKERMSMINKQDSDEEEEEQEVDMALKEQQNQNNHVQENKENTNNQQQHNQAVIGADQKIEQEDNQKQETNREQKENSENLNQVKDNQVIEKREKLITNHIQEEPIQQQQMIVQNQEEQIEQQIIAQNNKSKQTSPQLPTQLMVEQHADQYSSERGEQINQVVPQDKEIEKGQVEQSEEIIEQQEKGENNLINNNNLEQQQNQNNDSQQHNNTVTSQKDNQQEAEEKQQNQQLVQDQVEQNEKSNVIEQDQQAQIQSQEIEIEQEKKESNPNVEVQEVNTGNEQHQEQEIKEVEIQNIVISDDKTQNQILNEQQKVDKIERELESKQQNQEENIQQEVEEDQEKNLESPKNIMRTSFQNDDSNIRNQDDNKIMTIINLEDQIKSRQQENQEIEQEQEQEEQEQEQEQDNPNVIEVQDNENPDKD